MRQALRTAMVAVALSHVWIAGAAAQAGSVAPRATLARIGELMTRNSDEAAAAIATALSTWPDDPALHYVAGVNDLRRGAAASAESHLLTTIRLAPAGAAAYLDLGRLYQEQSAADATARGKAIEIYGHLLGVDPSNGEALFQSGLLLALEGRFGESLHRLDRLPEPVRARPQVLAVLAVAREGTGDSTGATTAAAALAADASLVAPDVLAVQPAFARLRDDRVPALLLAALDARSLAAPPALQALAAIHVAHGRLAEARAALERAAASGSPDAAVLIDLGRIAAKQGDPKAALGYLAHARSLEPKNPRVHFLFGIVCVQADLGREAYDALKQAVALDPDNPLVNYAMGAVALHRHDPSESIPYFERYVRLVPDDLRGRFALGAARYYTGQLDDAARDLRAAADSPKTAGGAHYYLARIARQQDDLVTAQKEIEQALALTPQLADAWAERGLIETRAGRYEEAERALTKALALDPDNYDATRHLAALYGRTRDPRRAGEEARLATLIEARDARMKDFLRLVEAVP